MKRKAIPVGVKLHATLLLLGFTEEEIQGGIDFDHHPALGLRAIDPVTGDYQPHSNDPRYIRPLRKADHDQKTFGRGGEKRATTADGDLHKIAKAKRLSKSQEEFQSRILRKTDPDVTTKTKRSSFKSRPFPKRKK